MVAPVVMLYANSHLFTFLQRYNALLLHESFTDENCPDQWPLEC